MKYIFGLILAAAFISCDNELNVVEDFKDIPVVYGFISMSDTAQYIRVERAFIDETESALVLAQNPDSLYYLNASVTLINNDSGMAYPLTMVDGNLEGYQREEGAFATSPNYIYKIKSTDIDLIAGDTYTLLIDRNDGTEAIEASTTMLGESDLKFPVASNGIKLPFSSIDLTRLTWQTSEFARIHNLSFDFNYRERGPETNGLFEKKTIEWRAVRNLKSDETRVSVDVEGVNFYTFLRGAIPIAQGVERRFEDITIKVQSGGEEINEFLQIASANVGITSTQDPPFFSNVEGGRGVFSSTYDLIIPKVALTNQTIDSIKDGQYTSELNFTN